MKYRKFLLVLMAVVLVAVAGTFGGMVFASGETTISNVLETGGNVGAISDQLAMTWALGTADDTVMPATPVPATLNFTVGVPVYIWVRTVNNSGLAIDRVQFRITAPNQFTINYSTGDINTWDASLPYDESTYYRFGAATGFTAPFDHDVATKFKITPTAAGVYTAQIYAVQLPA